MFKGAWSYVIVMLMTNMTMEYIDVNMTNINQVNVMMNQNQKFIDSKETLLIN